jgi:Protein of unknown function (DUF669)
MTTLNFDARTVEPSTGVGDPLPDGYYNVAISNSEMKPNSKGDGHYLALTFKVLDGAHTGRPLYSNLNLKNASQQAVEIAYRDLSAIGHAVGVLQIQDSHQLHGIPLKVKVGTQRQADRDPQNVIKAYKSVNDTGGQSAQPMPAWANAPIAQPQPSAPTSMQPPAQPAPQWQPPAQPQPWAQPTQQPIQQAAPQLTQQNVEQPPWMQQVANAAPTGAPPWATQK